MGTKLSPLENEKKITAIILCAGEGKRISEFIQDIPKPLIEVKNKPLLLHIVLSLKKKALNSIVIITGHLGKKIETFIASIKKTSIPFYENLKVVNSGEDYKKGPLYSFLSIAKDSTIFCKNQIYIIIPGDTYFNPDMFTEIYDEILLNLTILKKTPIIFFRKIQGINLKSNLDSKKQISMIKIQQEKPKILVKEIIKKQLFEIDNGDEIRQVIPIFAFDNKFVNRILDTEKNISANTIIDVVNYLIKQKQHTILAVPVKSSINFFDIDTKADLLAIKEEKEDNRRSD
jgi:NDP-sugar pyrophosphorylase family protein